MMAASAGDPPGTAHVETVQTLSALQGQLREDLLPWVLALYLIVGFALVSIEVAPDAPMHTLALGLCCLALVVPVWVLMPHNYSLAAWLAALGGMAIVVLAWHLYPADHLHGALVLPVVGAALTLGIWQTVALALLSSILLWLGGQPGPLAMAGTPPVLDDTILLWSITLLMCAAQRRERTILAWAWEGYARARIHLEVARDRHLELQQALADLALSTRETIRLNELLMAARTALEEARRAKEEFVANVSHELRTPLNMIIGFSDIMLDSPEVYARRLPGSLLADIAAIRRNSQHLASLVNDVLDMAELDTGRLQLYREWTSLHSILQEAIEAVAALFEKKGLSLTLDAPDDLPQVHCDRTRIRQVVLNLLSNAGRFTEQGGARVSASLAGQEVTVSVSDSGPGIEPEKLGHLFEPFQQGDPSIRRRYGGTGLGLTISRRFIEMHGGRIQLSSTLGIGTTASFTLPLIAPPPPTVSQRWFSPYHDYTPRTRRSRAPEVEVKPHVVVVEQGQALGHLLARYLDDVQIVQALSIEEAAAVANTCSAVAIVLNAAPGTPIPSTIDTALDIPILFCWVPEPQLALSRMGVTEYLIKPINRTHLVDTVQKTAPEARVILLVDDDPAARHLFSRILTSSGRQCTVLEAGDGETALGLLRARRPDLLLLDLVMPHMDGFAVLEEKAHDERIKDIPVVILSARDPHRDPVVSKELGVTRQGGLSAGDVMALVEAIIHALRPRFGVPAPHADPLAPPVSG